MEVRPLSPRLTESDHLKSDSPLRVAGVDRPAQTPLAKPSSVNSFFILNFYSQSSKNKIRTVVKKLLTLARQVCYFRTRWQKEKTTKSGFSTQASSARRKRESNGLTRNWPNVLSAVIPTFLTPSMASLPISKYWKRLRKHLVCAFKLFLSRMRAALN